MAIIFTDGMDHYTTVLNKWDSTVTGTSGTLPTINAAKGRNGTAGMYFAVSFNNNGSCYVQKNFSTLATYTVGAAFYIESYPQMNAPVELIGFYEGGVNQVSVALDNSGQIKVYTSWTHPPGTKTLLGTATWTVPFQVYFYLEVKVTFNTATGTVEVRKNGTSSSALSITGANTAPTGNNYAAAIRFGSSCEPFLGSNYNAPIRMDDLYILDSTGAINNTFLGDVRLGVVVPDGVGASTAWALTGAATNWQATNEVPPDGDTSYVSSLTVAASDLYTFQDTVAGAIIAGVILWHYSRKDEGAPRSMQGQTRQGVTTTATGVDIPLTTTYTYNGSVFEHDATGATWTGALFNSSQFGQKVTV